ncbi:MAG: hypothetical protein R2880_11135 [Deinococcales bacterium]
MLNGSIQALSSSPMSINVSFVNNSASNRGGAIANSGGSFTITNSIF